MREQREPFHHHHRYLNDSSFLAVGASKCYFYKTCFNWRDEFLNLLFLKCLEKLFSIYTILSLDF